MNGNQETRPESRPPGFTKVTFNLPISDVEALKELAKRQNTNVTTVVRRAIGTELYLAEVEANGGKFLIEQNGSLKEILRR